jgi:hypothetical protein
MHGALKLIRNRFRKEKKEVGKSMDTINGITVAGVMADMVRCW